MTHACLAFAQADASHAPEVRFRVRAANSSPRQVRVVALSALDDELRVCATKYGSNVRVSCASELASIIGARDPQAGDWTQAMNVASDAVAGWLGSPDLAIIVGTEGDDPRAAAFAAQAWCRRGVTVSAVLRPFAHHTRSEAAGCARTADALRPWCTMLVLASDNDYLVDLLDALGASRDT
ncbi:hypothetical protein J8I87_20945 [Paraburkholderia sp. LEh10]|uniref:hypothetical protein n=1 Tax=Paraburkholderia sp. LEh10 TaxID=2821353 RepID=UPI001AE171FF|nr:hypothetical protein [Paraburkholderia sp. LEh10]MBP0592151.1 hypothetical protein [Paraburkholderia sp. LEh10]